MRKGASFISRYFIIFVIGGVMAAAAAVVLSGAMPNILEAAIGSAFQ